ncbi:MAG TPA: phosphate ABC transporter permease subunit PstC [Solirubrobacterales bacterium]|nr:phosphate ABC transporter permease subunit PstC [Solirubrobacterales bacterium]
MSASASATRVIGHGAGVSDLRKRADSFGDRALFGICLLAALIAGALIILVGYQIVHGAQPAISKFGFAFVYETVWQPNFGVFGAGSLLFGTAVTSAFALLLGAPIAIAIGLFLTLLAPKGVGAVIGPLVELLAAIPSVILGFWGLLVLAPFVQAHVEPFLHGAFGFVPIFGAQETTGLSVFTASLILTIMVIPIIASISRDLFHSVPRELQDGAAALGATRWEVVRGVILPTTSSGVIAACILGLGRALGEAIAVSQVIGAGSELQSSLFKTGDTLASRIALQFPGALTELHKASLFYCGVILLVIGLASNLLAQWIGGRFSYKAGLLP